MIKKIWKKLTALVAFIVSILSIPFIDFIDLWQKIKSFTVELFKYAFFSTSEVPNWLLGIMFICVAVVALLVLALLKPKLFNRWMNYTSDTFYDLNWNWSFGSTKWEICILNSYCSKCSFQIFPESNYSNTTYRCDSCGHTVGPLNGSIEEVESIVRRSIHQKLRLDTWRSNNKSN
ncbi:hypothetical protein [Photobacterium leiognathi]|uniref:hypothetical protein n=1 Tax=Photobacterium leiognathi TaxID=553611 RepID=UPI00076A11F3|nr:hypothetical protein [Photobacterium leiognathi]